MSTYELAVRSSFQGFSISGFKAGFWKWWIGLYADAPRKLRPMI